MHLDWAASLSLVSFRVYSIQNSSVHYEVLKVQLKGIAFLHRLSMVHRANTRPTSKDVTKERKAAARLWQNPLGDWTEKTDPIPASIPTPKEKVNDKALNTFELMATKAKEITQPLIHPLPFSKPVVED
ncbi:hypothetical protein CEXT_121991 [Caerostris extrusa]|uniref:Uncharacterized protein n=1 Tax=Caerostris extrusa TaxID=172846 RepID=A0AAV4XSK2_CAEEX|nr:hypothetical protein CEXT_121991 [Caerostris extrusa]